MQLFFIDESGTIPPKCRSSNIEFFALGGVIIPEDLWHTIDKELTLIKSSYGVSGEIKWRNFSPQNESMRPHSLSHLSANEKEDLRISLYNLLKRFKSIRSICSVVNIQSAYKLDYVLNENDLYWYAYKKLTDRFQYELHKLSSAVGSKINGIIVCDHRQPKDDHLLRNLHQKLLAAHNSNSSVYMNLIEGVFIAPSHFSVGIQFADLVAGAIYRKFVRQDSRYFDMIQPLLCRSDKGIIDGHGIIMWPKDERDAVSVVPDPATIDAFTA